MGEVLYFEINWEYQNIIPERWPIAYIDPVHCMSALDRYITGNNIPVDLMWWTVVE